MPVTYCFRCDWRGTTDETTCPACGAVSLGRPEAATRQRGARPAAEPSSSTVAHVEVPMVPRGYGRSRLPLIAIGVAAAIALAAVGVIEVGLGAGAAGGPSRAAPASGTLVYLARAGDGVASLWLVDLGAGTTRAGPAVPRSTVRLVDLSGAHPGWVGVEHVAGDGRTVVSVLDGVRPGAGLRTIGRGDLVAWGPEGTSVVIARNARRQGWCVPVRIRLVTLATRKVAWALHDPSFCGPVLSISRSAVATYFTAPSGDRVGVYLTGSVGVPHVVFDGLAMLSASPPSAFLLAPAAALSAGRRPDLGLPPDETFLGWKGAGGPVAVAADDEPLRVERVLAWSPDGARAALLGSLGGREGIFVLEGGSGSSTRRPTFVMPAHDLVQAAFDRRGALFVAMDGEIRTALAGVASTLRLPGAPSPSGPLVWVP